MVDRYLRGSQLTRITYAITDQQYRDIAINDDTISNCILNIYEDRTNIQSHSLLTPAHIVVNNDEGNVIISIYTDIDIPNGHIAIPLREFLEKATCITRFLSWEM